MRLGVDLGGSKIEALALDPSGNEVFRKRVPAPRGDYPATLAAIAGLVREAGEGTLGIGMPGHLSAEGIVRNAYNTPLNGQPLKRDLEHVLARELRFANDGNCFALSEARDGAARGARVVFGAVLGTGAGGGLVIDGRLVEGRHAIAGEWGHNPLPWMRPGEYPGPICTCGRTGCIEQFVSGTALRRDGVPPALYADRLARALAHVVNLLDPDVIVLGGGVSNVDTLYADLPPLIARYAYATEFDAPVLRAAHGDASGVRGAAMLWDQG